MSKIIKFILKWIVLALLCIFALLSLFQILFALLLGIDSVTSDITIANGRYAITKTSFDSYDLYEGRVTKILPDVNGWYIVEKKKAYIKNNYHLVIIDEKHGDYIKKLLTEATPNELEIIEKMK